MNFNKDQQYAIDQIVNLNHPFISVLSGCAGSGKTTLCKYISDTISARSLSVMGVAPTHKAKKVLSFHLNNKSFMKISCMTVAALLNKTRQHSYIGTKRFRGTGSKINKCDFFIIDEASMVCDDDSDEIIKYAKMHNKSVLFVGDCYQIPNPSQILQENQDGSFSKADSQVFLLKNHFSLNTIMRQTNYNPLIDIYDYIRSNIYKSLDIPRKNNVLEDGSGIIFTTEQDQFEEFIKNAFTSLSSLLHETRIVCYTNECVRYYNKLVRKMCNKRKKFEIGWLLMGYENTGYPEPFISNGQDYYIMNTLHTTTHAIHYFTNLVGDFVTLKEVEEDTQITIFFIEVSNVCNYELMSELTKRAIKVNSRNSTIEDFKQYVSLKNLVFFTETIYRLDNGDILTESQIQESHPLLAHSTVDVINENFTLKKNKLIEKIQTKYPFLLQNRLDDRKIISREEKLYDKYQIVSKDLDDGIAITAHKSQGSTYNTVFIDEEDFEKVVDVWDYKNEILEKRTKEKNQLLYVSYTRPRKSAYVLYTEK